MTTSIVDHSMQHLTWANPITIRYLSKTAEAPPLLGPATPEITHVLWRTIRKDRIASDSVLQKYDRTFRIPKATARGIVPKENDIIVDDLGIRWKVELVEIVSYGWEYRCHTTKSMKQGLPVGSPEPVAGGW